MTILPWIRLISYHGNAYVKFEKNEAMKMALCFLWELWKPTWATAQKPMVTRRKREDLI